MVKVYFRWVVLFGMKKKEAHIFHWILLGAIPILLLLGMLKKAATFDIQWHDTYYIVSAFHFSLALSVGLAIKALLYYLTRTYPFSKFLCYFDIIVTGTICVWSFFPSTSVYEGQILEVDLYLILLIVLWVLIQFSVFINFFVHLLLRTDKSIGGKT